MTSTFAKEMNTTCDDLADDAKHPIPEVGACDIKGVRKGGGADLVVVIAAPLGDDERSRRRFVQKIRNYLGHINSEEYFRECGSPAPETTSIVVQIHPDSDPNALVFIEQCREWIRDNHASLAVKKLANQSAHPPLASGQRG